jgi:RNA polymerase sigma-70 factor (ECF subfamily)
MEPFPLQQTAHVPLETELSPSFTQFYRQHLDRVYRYLLARTGNIPTAEDLTAETFHAAFQKFEHYNPQRSAPTTWLIGIARHKLADHWRRARPHIPLETAETLPARQPSTEERAARRLQMAQVSAALQEISPERAEALALHFFGGLSVDETAQAMGKHSEAVKKLLQRGLADLRQRLITPEVLE